jgi:hypothetical protein
MTIRTALAITGMMLFIVGCDAIEAGSNRTEDQSVVTRISAIDTSLQDTHFSDANGWSAPLRYSTMAYPDLNGDGRSDACGRGADGIWCEVDDGAGHFVNGAVWAGAFSDASGWDAPQYYSTIRYANVDGDASHRSDVCGRGSGGIWCAVSNGTSFTGLANWQSEFSDSSGWNLPQYYSTIQFPDLNNDGKADVCGRGIGGIYCALSTGSSFGPLSLWNGDFSDGSGWAAPEYYSTLQFPDLNKDGSADVCGRGTGGVWCALSTGTSFGSATLWESTFSDANGWAAPEYNSTIQYTDVTNDGKADLCARSAAGMLCASSTGTGFNPPVLWSGDFSDAAGWNFPEYYSTLHIQNNVLCGRGGAGVYCAFANRANTFEYLSLESRNETDGNGWSLPQYYRTMAFPDTFEILERGSGGVNMGRICPHNVNRQSPTGQIIAHPNVYFLFWTNYWSTGIGATSRTQLINTWSSMAANPLFYGQMSEYGITGGSYRGNSVTTANLGADLDWAESAIQNELLGEIGVNGVPLNDRSTLYVIVLPPDHQSDVDCLPGLGQECVQLGHHAFAPLPFNNPSNLVGPVWYAVIENSSVADRMNIVIGHEIAEAATDPDTQSGWRDSTWPYGEIADLCTKLQRVPNSPTTPVLQEVWSSAQCACRGMAGAVPL